ncbi:MAG: hypothetical protein K6E29_08430 [Cyanobacteria bacterium RUI128]|nr:hypothetical protein [Cyanobacteria bacterium RUI128]
MEKEWFHKDYQDYPEEIRLARLEEYVFGTIHDTDFRTRYENLQKAFDIRKRKQSSNARNTHRFGGVPTSVPMNIEHLTGR